MKVKIILLLLIVGIIACSNSNEPNKNSPYGGERGWDSMYVYPQLDTMIYDSVYTLKYKLVTDFEMTGKFYIYQGVNILNIDNSTEEYDEDNTRKLTTRFHTSKNSNEYDLTVTLKFQGALGNREYQFFQIYLDVDSILIDKDTLYRYTLGPDNHLYKFPVKEKRWYNLKDSIANNDSDYYYLQRYFLYSTFSSWLYPGISHNVFIKQE